MSILHKSKAQKQLKHLQILISGFPSMILLFYLLLEGYNPHSNCIIRRCFQELLENCVLFFFLNNKYAT